MKYYSFPPWKKIRQLQFLRGKETFLRISIVNYVEIEKGFVRLLKKDAPFIWDDQYQCSFDALEQSLMSTLVLIPPNYDRDFFLYFAANESTLGMVLVQEDD